MSIDTQTRIAEIKARAAAATPGPWRAAKWGDGSQDDMPSSNVFWDDGEAAVCIDILTRDATFIAHARADIDWLVAEVERLQSAKSVSFADMPIGAEFVSKAAYERLQDQLDEINKDGAGLLEENRRMRDVAIDLQSSHGYIARLEARLREALYQQYHYECIAKDYDWHTIAGGLDAEEYVDAEMAELRLSEPSHQLREPGK